MTTVSRPTPTWARKDHAESPAFPIRMKARFEGDPMNGIPAMDLKRYWRDNTFADTTTSFDFESHIVEPTWRIKQLNSLDWDETEGPVPPPSSSVMQASRGFLPRTGIPQRRDFRSMHRYDESFHRLNGGQVIVVVRVPDPRQPHRPDEELTRRWAVVKAAEVDFPLATPADVKRFHRITGLPAKQMTNSKAKQYRTVLCAQEVLDRSFYDDHVGLGSAESEAVEWAMELGALDANRNVTTVIDADVLYNANVTDGGAGIGHIEGPLYPAEED